ncbi:MAG: peptide-methionine (S)-S-oxide reductase MsrA [Alphaproteobacteria bacterium]|nr:peptide-methionine (S)-S-oxide reductase MsrA [Alphaproteobacteria bacterium]
MKTFLLVILILTPLVLLSIVKQSKGMEVADTIKSEIPENAALASFAGGCFWCMESEFRALNGVVYTISGYEGGDFKNPSYQDVTTGKTGHAETTQIYYDPNIITYRELADHFLRKAHDPTQLNRQGVDVGTQYRSVIFYHNEDQKKEAEAAVAAATKDHDWKDEIVTKIEPAQTFWPAEEYHQQYYEKYEQANGRPHIRVLLKHKNK